jgi:hypothetical protein
LINVVIGAVTTLAVIPIVVESARDVRANHDRAIRADANVYLSA